MRTFSMGLVASLLAVALLPVASDAAPPAAGHFRYAIDTAAGNADYSRTAARQTS